MAYFILLFCICVIMLLLDYGFGKSNAIHSNKNQEIVNAITMLVLIFVAGFRNTGGSDYVIYRIVYNEVPTLITFFKEYSEIYKYHVFGMEKGYLLICSFFKTIGMSYNGFIFLYTVITMNIMYLATKKYTNNYSMVIIVILYKMLFYDYFISLRQTITIVLFMIMIKYIEEKEWKKYFLMCCICTYIHTGAIILFLVYFINRFKITRKNLLILNAFFLITLIMSIINIPILKVLTPITGLFSNISAEVGMKAERYINANSTPINILHTLEYFGIMIIVILNYDKFIKKYPHAEIVIKIFLCMLPIFTAFRNYEILRREKDYFILTYGFILGYWCLGMKNRANKVLTVSLIIAWCAFGFFRYINEFDNGELKSYMPVIFDKSISFFVDK